MEYRICQLLPLTGALEVSARLPSLCVLLLPGGRPLVLYHGKGITSELFELKDV